MLRRLFTLTLVTACAPVASMRPAGELLERQRTAELGVAMTGLGPRPYVVESWQYIGEMWGTVALGHDLEISGIGLLDDQAVAGGGAVRWTPLRPHPLAVGVEVEAGFAWAAFSLPFSLHVAPPFWIYSAPRLGNLGYYLTPSLPLGLSLETLPGLVLRAEAQISWEQFLAYQRRTHAAAGLAYQW